jgi:hypothetical protein
VKSFSSFADTQNMTVLLLLLLQMPTVEGMQAGERGWVPATALERDPQGRVWLCQEFIVSKRRTDRINVSIQRTSDGFDVRVPAHLAVRVLEQEHRCRIRVNKVRF